MQIRKQEVKLSLFEGNVIVYIENSKETIKQLLELTDEFNNISGCKFNI